MRNGGSTQVRAKTVENRIDTIHKSYVRYIKTERAPNPTFKWVVGCYTNTCVLDV
jgi:hypothetical protein